MDLNNRIDEINLNTIKMFELTNKYLKDAGDILLNHQVINVPVIDDEKINAYERKIEEECLLIILRERPFAIDLRKVTGIFKLVEDIERLSDHALDLVWTTTNLLKYSESTKFENLKLILKLAFKMVTDSYEAFVNNDEKLATDVVNRDDEVDALYLKVLDEIPHKKDKNNLDDNFIIYATLLAKYAERIADHASNIAEWVVYIKSGYYKDKVII
jgi:phosphate transport system protein